MGGPVGPAGWVKVQKPLRLMLSWRIMEPRGEQQATTTSVITGSSINILSLLDFFCFGRVVEGKLMSCREFAFHMTQSPCF